MSVVTAHRLAQQLERSGEDVHVMWHGGEPLTVGLRHFEQLYRQLQNCSKITRHSVQTNAVLLDEHWAEFFATEGIGVGVSIDGNVFHNSFRVDRKGRGTHKQTMDGVENLRKYGIDISLLAVVHERNIGNAERMYEYARSIGAKSLGINVLEIEAENTVTIRNDQLVQKFWSDLFDAWLGDVSVSVREVDGMLRTIRNRITFDPTEAIRMDYFPSVSVDGDVVLLSPELLGCRSERFSDFQIGNINTTALNDLLESADEIGYVWEYKAGLMKCRSECGLFTVCGGGFASNKFSEFGRLDVTETVACRNSIKNLCHVLAMKLEEVTV